MKAVLGLIILAFSVNAMGAVTTEQRVDANWMYGYKVNDDTYNFYTPSTSWIQFDQTVHDVDLASEIPDTLTGNVRQEATATAPDQIRSRTELDLDVLFDADYEDLYEVEVSTFNLIKFTETFSTTSDDGKYIGFGIRTTGGFDHQAQLKPSANNYVWEMVLDSDNRILTDYSGPGNPVHANGDDWSTNSREDAFNPTPINHTRQAQYDVFALLPYTGVPLEFGFTYEDTSRFAISGIDAPGFEVGLTNDFMSTVELYAAVYDSNKQLIQGATVENSNGFSFGSLPGDFDSGLGTPSIPAPGALPLLLSGCGFLAAAVRRRKITV